jgi:hypothetical protein
MSKGLAETTLVILVLTMIGAGVLGGFTYKYVKSQQEHAPEEVCKLSIFKAAQLKKVSGGKQLSPLDCERTDLIITKDDIVEDGKINQERASFLLAQGMKRCWDMVGNGRMDPFSNWNNPDQSYCLICKNIKFDEPLKKFLAESENDLGVARKRGDGAFVLSPIPYIQQTTVPGRDETYWRYFYKSDPRLSQQDFAKINAPQAVKEDSVILVNMYKIKAKSELLQIAAAAGGVVLVIGGFALAATGVGAVIGVPLIKIGAGLTAAGVVAYLVFVPLIVDSYAECRECNGVGGIAIVPPGMDFNQKIPVAVGGEVKQVPICTTLVN